MIRNLLLIFFISLANWNCRYTNNSKAQNMGVSENIILIALKERTDLEFDNRTRALHTIVNDSSKFEHRYLTGRTYSIVMINYEKYIEEA
tara:strand:+ start:591 stop:860 length:270 start_codon:yes stop_codon:yes gene_type:complete